MNIGVVTTKRINAGAYIFAKLVIMQNKKHVARMGY